MNKNLWNALVRNELETFPDIDKKVETELSDGRILFGEHRGEGYFVLSLFAPASAAEIQIIRWRYAV